MTNRKMITIWRIVKAGGKNFIRNSWLSIAATAVMVVALTIVLFAIVLSATTKGAIKEISKDYKVSVYLRDGIKEEQWRNLQTVMSNNQYVASVEYVSAEEASKRFSERASAQSDTSLLQGLSIIEGEILPASLEISVTNLDKMNEVADIARAQEYSEVVEEISIGKLGKIDAQKAIDRAAAAQRFIISAGIVAATIFGLVSVLIIFNTIRMAVFTRSEEIRIMKLIGATPNYIRGPFIVEACVYGVIAGFIAHGATYSLILSLGSKVAAQPEFASTYEFFVQPVNVLILLAGTVVTGMMIGMISSMLAMERYLKLKDW